jgi:hypothetical protein
VLEFLHRTLSAHLVGVLAHPHGLRANGAPVGVHQVSLVLALSPVGVPVADALHRREHRGDDDHGNGTVFGAVVAPILVRLIYT